MYLYRIEHSYDNAGPYNSGANDIHRGLSSRAYDHPTPECDGLINFSREFFCGFTSITQLLYWFYIDDRKYLQENGFKLYRIKVDEGYKGPNQAIFHKEGYTIESELNLINPKFNTRIPYEGIQKTIRNNSMWEEGMGEQPVRCVQRIYENLETPRKEKEWLKNLCRTKVIGTPF